MKYTTLIPNGRENIDDVIFSAINQIIKPKMIIVYDNKKIATPLKRHLYKICEYNDISLIYTKVKPSSIAQIRYELLKLCTTEYFLFLDDDVLINYDYTQILFNILNSDVHIAATQGVRLECNGREEGNAVDIHVMNNSNAGDNVQLDYGDTFALLGRTNVFLTIPNWIKIIEKIGFEGVTGEDVLMGHYVIKQNLKIIGTNKTFGYHLASNNFSYWNTFLASDANRLNSFNDDLYK